MAMKTLHRPKTCGTKSYKYLLPSDLQVRSCGGKDLVQVHFNISTGDFTARVENY